VYGFVGLSPLGEVYRNANAICSVNAFGFKANSKNIGNGFRTSVAAYSMGRVRIGLRLT
tara:strand:- start:174 stop:350 length:177 start_codon:yes stop_codon:yes gene_type:complete